MADYRTITVTVEDGVAVVTLNRPQARNAMDADMWRELPEVFRALDADPAIRVAVLAAAGPHFCAGIDLGLLQSIAPVGEGDPARRQDKFRRVIRELQAAVTVLEEVRFPVIAAIQGACLGAGVDLVAAADIRVASADAVFRIEEINVGIVADLGSLQRLPRLMPLGVVRELALTGRDLKAGEAETRGLVAAVLPDAAAARARALELARGIAAKSPLAVAGTKAVLNHARDHTVADGLDHVAVWNAGHLSVDDVMRSLSAGRAKSSPNYSDVLK